MENLGIYTNLMRIDLGKIRYNYESMTRYIKERSPNSEAGVVLKSNAYGIGIKEVAPIVYSAGARRIFVMYIEEANTVRKVLPNDAYVYVLSGVLAGTEKEFFELGVVPVLSNKEQLMRWLDYAKVKEKRLPCVIKFDTGMHRMGIDDTEIDWVNELELEKYLDVHYVMTHMYCAHLPGNKQNDLQIARLDRLKNAFPRIKTSFSNTYSMFLNDGSYSDLFRVGRGLYGLFDRALNEANYPSITKCAFSVDARVIQVKDVKVGGCVGYGATHVFQRDSRVATLGIGYSHGFPTLLGNKAKIMVNGRPARVVGSVTMEYIMLDVTDNGPVEQESWITIIDSEETAEQFSSMVGVTGLEIMLSLGRGVQKKVYYNSMGCSGG